MVGLRRNHPQRKLERNLDSETAESYFRSATIGTTCPNRDHICGKHRDTEGYQGSSPTAETASVLCKRQFRSVMSNPSLAHFESLALRRCPVSPFRRDEDPRSDNKAVGMGCEYHALHKRTDAYQGIVVIGVNVPPIGQSDTYSEFSVSPEKGARRSCFSPPPLSYQPGDRLLVMRHKGNYCLCTLRS